MWSVEDSRRWDSLRNRWSSRSFLRLAASEASSSPGAGPALSRIKGVFVIPDGGFELWNSS